MPVTGTPADNGAFAFSGSALQFTKGAGAGGQILGWDGDGIADNGQYRVAASYTTSWVMEATVTNTAAATASEFGTVGIEVATGDGYAAIMVLRSGELSRISSDINSQGSGPAQAVPASSNLRLRLSWDAAAKVLQGSYSANGGTSFVPLLTVPGSDLGAGAANGFFFEVFANARLEAAVTAGQMVVDNFSITPAPTFTGSDDFAAANTKWEPYDDDTDNGSMVRSGGRLNFTKGTGAGEMFLMWDGDGIADNDAARMPLSYTTSWVMDATVTNLTAPGANTYAAVGIEVASDPDSYTGIYLENFAGQLYVLGETNSIDNFVSEAVGSSTVRLRIAWNAATRVLTGSYSLNDGATYAVLAEQPIADWPVSPAGHGFYFGAVGDATMAAAITAGQATIDNVSITTAAAFTRQPVVATTVAVGGNVTLSAATAGSGTLQWQHNGRVLTGATAGSLTLTSIEPSDTGIYQAAVAGGGTGDLSAPAIVGVETTEKLVGPGTQVLVDQVHPNGNVYDQLLLEGGALTFTSDASQVTRMSFLDPDGDIVQVEYAGAGTVSVVLAGESGPQLPAKYNQNVTYMQGLAGIVITGANATSNLSVFSVGRANAVNQALFRDDVTYDGFADIAFVAITSADGRFGGLRTANVSYVGTQGHVGVYAPGVQFDGPVYVGDVTASDSAQPVLVTGNATQGLWITGGELRQLNDQPVAVRGLTQLHFKNGSSSHGDSVPARPNQARLEEDGVDVTTAIVVNP